MRVRKAVFPAAGWGTRFLPATKAQPKEMLPLVDKPIIQYAVEEAVAAGIEQVIIVTSSQKRAIEDHFDLSYELEHLLEEKGDIEMLRQVRAISDLAQVAYVRQKEQLGLGHAVLMAKDLIGHEPFAVILPDDVVVARPAVHRPADPRLPPDARLGRGGDGGPARGDRAATASSPRSRPTIPLDHGRLHRITRLVEKPAPEDAPSNLAVIGRYVLTPKIFDKLEQTKRGAGGEIQLTDAIAALMEEQQVFGYEFEGVRYDAGTTMGWLQASVEIALDPTRPGHRVPGLPARTPALTRLTRSGRRPGYVTLEVIVIAAIRIAGSLPVLRWALFGGLLAILVDLSDLLLMGVLDLGGVPDYQNLDKWLDQVYLALFLVVALRWTGPARTISIVLYAYRLIGFVLYRADRRAGAAPDLPERLRVLVHLRGVRRGRTHRALVACPDRHRARDADAPQGGPGVGIARCAAVRWHHGARSDRPDLAAPDRRIAHPRWARARAGGWPALMGYHAATDVSGPTSATGCEGTAWPRSDRSWVVDTA